MKNILIILTIFISACSSTPKSEEKLDKPDRFEKLENENIELARQNAEMEKKNIAMEKQNNHIEKITDRLNYINSEIAMITKEEKQANIQASKYLKIMENLNF